MSRKWFGTDGIRGVAGPPPLSADLVLSVGRALAGMLRDAGTRPQVVVGRDTRWSGDMLEAAFCAGLSAEGADVQRLGIVPTPAVAAMLQERGAHAGAVISASHNPYQDNGIKLFGPDGFKLSDAQELELERRILAHQTTASPPAWRSGTELGRIQDLPGARDRYLERLRQTLPAGLGLGDLRIVVDAAHGAASGLAHALFESLGAEVIALGNGPDGTNINTACGALHPESLRAMVLESDADLGIALDGDADRLIAVDESGQIRNGDDCLALFACDLLASDRLHERTVVATQMSNLGLERYLKERGIRLIRTQVGDRYVVETMRAGGFTLGGEQSGHLVLLKHATTGDGMLAALHLAAMLQRAGTSLSSLLSGFHVIPQLLVNVRFKVRRDLAELTNVLNAIEAAEQRLGERGRVLVRLSGTEPLARVMLEGDDAQEIRLLAERIVGEIEAALG